MLATETITLPEYKIAVLNTGHITAEDNDLLEIPGCPLLLANDEQSHWLYIPSADGDPAGIDHRLADLRNFGASDSLLNLIRIAYDQGVHFLRLDSAGDEIENLPLFDW